MSDFRLHRGVVFPATFQSSRQLPSAAVRQMHGSITFVSVAAIPFVNVAVRHGDSSYLLGRDDCLRQWVTIVRITSDTN